MPSSNERNRKNTNKARPQKVQNNGKRRPTNRKRKPTEDGKKPIPRKTNKTKKNGKMKLSDKYPKAMMAVKIFIILFLLLCIIGAGIVAGMFFGLFGDEFEITKEELQIGVANSVVVDEQGGVLANLSGDEKRKVIKLEDMADYLPKAYVAIEDERFYKHNGVDIKRTGGAILKTLTGDSSYGGSTITQQLVKNITNDKQSSGIDGIIRKVKEWAKAYQVERMISKDQILELYLNILFVGSSSNLHGVELGAEYYFNKSAKDLTLEECAFMAGINNSPSLYKPFSEEEKDKEFIRKRTLTVLGKMKELGFVENEEEYNTAVAKVEEGLAYEKGETATGSNYSYHTDATIEQVIKQVMEEKDISRELAQNYVYSSGLTIYSTENKEIQDRIQEEAEKEKYILKGRQKNQEGTGLLNEHSQAAFAMIDHKTGKVVGVSGGLGEKTGTNLNRATQSVRQPGSAIKPIVTVGPALQEKIITAATVYDDVETDFNGYTPKNDGKVYLNLIDMRRAVARSQNIPQVKIMKELTPSKAIDYLREFGVTSLKKASEVERGVNHDEVDALAIGGAANGISPLEMAAAYAAIANNGEYITPIFYTKVEDTSGNVVLEPKQEKRRVLSEQNAYILKTILQEPVKAGGTATYCAIPGIDVAAKTGTTDQSRDRWLCGFTPYYASACWFGYDQQEEVVYNGTNPAGQIWDAIMTDVHTGLENATFTRPSGIVEGTVCDITGGLASTGCTKTHTEIFTADNMPQKCEGHGSQQICTESGKVATAYCPSTRTNVYGGVPPKEKLNLWKPIKGSSSSGSRVDETCNIHTRPTQTEQPTERPNTNNTPSRNNTTNTAPVNNTTNTNTNTNPNPPTTNTGNNTSNTNTGGGDNTTNTETD